MIEKMKHYVNERLFHYIGLIQEPYYSWINALVNKLILLRNPERVTHLGELHPDKTFYVITDLSPSVGIGGWYDRVLGYILRARTKGWIPVVYPPPPAQHDDGDWYAFFKEISPYPVEEVLQSSNVVYATQQGMIHKRYNRKEIAKRNKITKDIVPSDSLKRFLDEKLISLFLDAPSPMIAVRYRGTDYRSAIGHAKVPDIKYFCDRIEKNLGKWGIPRGDGEHIFIVTEEQEALDFIRNRFPRCRYVEKERFSNFEQGSYLCYRRLPTIKPLENNYFYLLEIYAMSQCDYLMGGINGAVLMALNLNGNRYKGVDVLNTGVN